MQSQQINPSDDAISKQASAPASAAPTLHLSIQLDDLTAEDTLALIATHLGRMHACTPAESVHALDVSSLKDACIRKVGRASLLQSSSAFQDHHPDILFWAARTADGQLAGIAALKRIDSERGEIKSMRVADRFLGQGVGRALLRHVTAHAQSCGMKSLWLETGSTAPFVPARRLYASEGFEECPPFPPYLPDPLSTFMTRRLSPSSEKYRFRPGQKSDLEAVRSLSHLSSDDYVPKAWEAYCDDRDQNLPSCRLPFVMIDAADRVVACFAVVLQQSHCELHALRVDQSLQRRGLGSRVVDFVLSLAREKRIATVSFSTSDSNSAMSAMSEKKGFSVRFSFLNWVYQPSSRSSSFSSLASTSTVSSSSSSSSSSLFTLPASHSSAVMQLLNKSDDYAQTRQWYVDGWADQPLSANRVQKHLSANEIVSLHAASDAELTNFAIFRKWEKTHRGIVFWLSWIEARNDADRHALLSAVVSKFSSEGRLIAQLPKNDRNQQLLTANGFVADPLWGSLYHCYSIQI